MAGYAIFASENERLHAAQGLAHSLAPTPARGSHRPFPFGERIPHSAACMPFFRPPRPSTPFRNCPV
jgi:hypothetical protein